MYLYEALTFAEEGKYDEVILQLLNPKKKEKKDKTFKDEHAIVELKVTIECISGNELSEIFESFYKRRTYWELHYKGIGHRFLVESENKSEVVTQQKNKKIGRNDPCPCGSGKKYKKCCID